MTCKVLVTGGTGFIASHLVRLLLDRGHEVAISTRYKAEIRHERIRDIWPRLTVFEADIRDRSALGFIAEWKPQIVYHMAGYIHVGQSFDRVEECFAVNALGTANALDSSSCAQRFVYMGTSEIYGKQDTVPWHEEMAPNPVSPYSISKYAGELYCRMRQSMDCPGPRTVCVRAFNTYGPWQSTKSVIPEMITRGLRGEPLISTLGEQTREYNYVGDIVEGLYRAGTVEEPPAGVVNLCSGEEVQIKRLVKLIAELTGGRSEVRLGALPYRPTEIWRMVANNAKAWRTLGWNPKVPFEDGLRLTVEWFRKYMERQSA